jgi:predicted nucleic acid-binding protein
MNDRFVDTSGWAAWIEPSDKHHFQAVEVFNDVIEQGGKFITTNWVLVELTTLLTSPIRFAKTKQIKLFGEIRRDPCLSVVTIDVELEAVAWKLWEDRADKQWTLVDCSSFVVMSRYGLREALTADRHFEQAGFIKLL